MERLVLRRAKFEVAAVALTVGGVSVLATKSWHRITEHFSAQRRNFVKRTFVSLSSTTCYATFDAPTHEAIQSMEGQCYLLQ